MFLKLMIKDLTVEVCDATEDELFTIVGNTIINLCLSNV
jgi:hypothetical protein